VLQARVRRPKAEQREVLRARIVLAAGQGAQNRQIAERLGIAPNTASKLRKRFFQEGLAGLVDRDRPGRPRASPPAVIAEVKAIACELPALRAVPLSRFSVADVREEAIACGLVEQVSVSTVWRWLDEDALKLWRHRSWIFPRAPDFAPKAGVVLDLYQRWFGGERLGPDEFVVSADEKTSGPAPVAAATRPGRRPTPGPCGWSTSPSAAARWPTWSPGTWARPGCLAAASPPPASRRSVGWSSR
jgi:transposase